MEIPRVYQKIIVIVFLVFVAWFLYKNINGYYAVKGVETSDPVQPVLVSDDVRLRGNFVYLCTQHGEKLERCSCAGSYINDNYGFNEFNQYNKTQKNTVIVEAVKACY